MEQLTLVASCSICFSAYMFLRVGSKYFYHLGYLGLLKVIYVIFLNIDLIGLWLERCFTH